MACTDCNKKTPCHKKKCGCKIKGLTADCVVYTPEDLTCTGVRGNDTLENIIKGIDRAICEKLNGISGGGSLVNIGNGSKVFAGVNTQGQSQIRSFTSSDSTITIVEGATTIDLTAKSSTSLVTFGTANPVYVGENINGKSQITTLEDLSTSKHTPIYDSYVDGNHKFAGIISDTIDIQKESDGNIRIETPPPFTDDGIPRFIVNNLYTGVDELGTVGKPYKTIQNALDAFEGTGTPDIPQYQNGIIIIQKGDDYNFTGNFTYRNLNVIVEEGAVINHNPSATDKHIMNLNLLDESANVINTLQLATGVVINLHGDGFQNKGVTPTATTSKKIKISGNRGLIRMYTPFTNDYTVIKGNAENENFVRNTTGGLFTIENAVLRSNNNAVIRTGRDSTIYIYEGVDLRADSSNTPPFEFNGGLCEMYSTLIIFAGNSTYDKGFSMQKERSFTTSLRMHRCTIQTDATVTELFKNENTDKGNPELVVKYNNDRFGKIVDVFGVDDLSSWNTINFSYNNFDSGNIDVPGVDLTSNNQRSVNNIIGGDVINTLRVFTGRTTASAGGVKKGGMFFNTTDDIIDMVI